MYNYTSTRDSLISSPHGSKSTYACGLRKLCLCTHAAFLGLKRYFENLSSFTTRTLIRPMKNHRQTKEEGVIMIRHKISVETSPVPTQELTQRRCCRRMLTRRSCHGAQMSTHSLNVNMHHQLLFSCSDCFRWKMGSWCIEFREK